MKQPNKRQQQITHTVVTDTKENIGISRRTNVRRMDGHNIMTEATIDWNSLYDAKGKLYLQGKWLIEESTSHVWRKHLLMQ